MAASIFAARSGLPNRFISDIYVDPQNPAHVWVSLERIRHAARVQEHEFGSELDAREHRPAEHAGRLDRRRHAAGARPVLYVGTDVGVFRSTNNGGNWSRFGTGLPNSVVLDLVLDRAHNTLTAATHGRGVWVTGL